MQPYHPTWYLTEPHASPLPPTSPTDMKSSRASRSAQGNILDLQRTCEIWAAWFGVRNGGNMSQDMAMRRSFCSKGAKL